MTTKEKLERLWKIRSMEPGCVPISEMSWLLDELQEALEFSSRIEDHFAEHRERFGSCDEDDQ